MKRLIKLKRNVDQSINNSNVDNAQINGISAINNINAVALKKHKQKSIDDEVTAKEKLIVIMKQRMKKRNDKT